MKIRACAVASAVAVLCAVPASASAVDAGPSGPDDHSPRCVTLVEYRESVKPVDRQHFSPFAMTRREVNQWFDAGPRHVREFSGDNVGGIFTGGTLRWQSYRACFGLPNWGVPRGEAVIVVQFAKSPVLRQSGFYRYITTDAWTL